MKLAFEIVAIWTVLNFVIGIPVWMLVKTRDRREMLANGLDYEASYANEASSGFANPAPSYPGRRSRLLPLVAAAGRLVPDAGSTALGTVSRVGTDHRSVDA